MNEIFIRRSVREFDGRKVEPSQLERILRAAMQAPSARNQRPWRFLVTQDPLKLRQLSEASPYARAASRAPLALVVLCDMDALSSPNYWQHDLGACVQNILLEACHLGLGTCWMGLAPNEERVRGVRKVFDLPDSVVPFALVAVGHPAEGTGNVFVDRFEPSWIHQEKW